MTNWVSDLIFIFKKLTSGRTIVVLLKLKQLPLFITELNAVFERRVSKYHLLENKSSG
jgi:hypothetical protein